jgi:hypothetical protein
MRRALATIIVLSVVPLVLPAQTATSQQKQQGSKKKASPKTGADTLTGCVDQQDGQYVLIREQSRSLVANLEAEGFPTEGFAKYVGHKVTVRGTSTPAGSERPVFRVRGVENVSDSCGPQLH